MKTRSRVILLIALLLMALPLGAFLFALSASYVTRRRAEGLLAAVQQIRVGVSDYKAVSQITAPYRAYSTESSNGGEHQIQFKFYNEWLLRLKLAPYTDFIVHIDLKDDAVIEKAAREFVASRGCGASVLEVKRGLPFPEASAGSQESNHLVFGLSPNSPTPAMRISVYDDDSYGETGRRKDWGFNLSCLTRLGGCQDAREMLPGAVPTEP